MGLRSKNLDTARKRKRNISNVVASRDDLCSRARLGYSPLDVAHAQNVLSPTTYVRHTTRALTRVMILHPIAAVLSALSLVFALASPVIGNSIVCLFTTATFIVTALAMVSDFVLFDMVRAVANQDGATDASAKFGAAMWSMLVSAFLTFVAMVFALGACCVGRSRRRRRRDAEKMGEASAAPTSPTAAAPEAASADGAAQPKKRFWRRG